MALNALHRGLAIPPHRLKVEGEHGWSDWAYQRTCAESDARRVLGVDVKK